jgi:hypothetical protein
VSHVDIACHIYQHWLLFAPYRNHGSQFEKQKTAFEDGGATNIVDEEKVPGSTETINEKP